MRRSHTCLYIALLAGCGDLNIITSTELSRPAPDVLPATDGAIDDAPIATDPTGGVLPPSELPAGAPALPAPEPTPIAADPATESSDASDPTANPTEQAPTPPQPVALDACDDPTYAGAAWLTHGSTHFTFHTFAGTAAERDLPEITARREAAYDEIRAALAVTAEPMIDVYLAPNRLAALEHGTGFGVAYGGWDRYDAIYTGAPDGYESARWGHELTHLLAYYIAPEHGTLPLLDEGLAELFDQSGRDLHAAYAEQLTAGGESRVHLVAFDDGDLWGQNYGRAGSFVQLLVERYGMPRFLDIWRAAFVDWQGGCQAHPDLGCIDTPERLTALVDTALTSTTGESFATLQAAWREAIAPALARPATVGAEDAAAIRNLVALTDLALNSDDAAIYRSTLEGFYCDWQGESGREQIAARAVAAFAEVSSEVVAIYAAGTANFPVAYALVTRREARGAATGLGFWFERGLTGWRVSWSDDWR